MASHKSATQYKLWELLSFMLRSPSLLLRTLTWAENPLSNGPDLWPMMWGSLHLPPPYTIQKICIFFSYYIRIYFFFVYFRWPFLIPQTFNFYSSSRSKSIDISLNFWKYLGLSQVFIYLNRCLMFHLQIHQIHLCFVHIHLASPLPLISSDISVLLNTHLYTDPPQGGGPFHKLLYNVLNIHPTPPGSFVHLLHLSRPPTGASQCSAQVESILQDLFLIKECRTPSSSEPHISSYSSEYIS